MPLNDAHKIILLVEDNENDATLTLRALEKNGIRNPVIIARDGLEALDYLFAAGQYSQRPVAELPYLIILDLKLPKLNGLDVLRRIRSDEGVRHIPVVVLTTSLEEHDIGDAYRFGTTNAYLRKPVDFQRFVEAMDTLGEFWLSLNQFPDTFAGKGGFR